MVGMQLAKITCLLACGLYDSNLSNSKYIASDIRMKPNNEWERVWEKVVMA